VRFLVVVTWGHLDGVTWGHLDGVTRGHIGGILPVVVPWGHLDGVLPAVCPGLDLDVPLLDGRQGVLELKCSVMSEIMRG